MQGCGNDYNCSIATCCILPVVFCGIIRILIFAYASNSVTCHFYELIMMQSTI